MTIWCEYDCSKYLPPGILIGWKKGDNNRSINKWQLNTSLCGPVPHSVSPNACKMDVGTDIKWVRKNCCHFRANNLRNNNNCGNHEYYTPNNKWVNFYCFAFSEDQLSFSPWFYELWVLNPWNYDCLSRMLISQYPWWRNLKLPLLNCNITLEATVSAYSYLTFTSVLC